MFQALLFFSALPFILLAFRHSDAGSRDTTSLFVWVSLTCFIFCAMLLSRSMPDGVTLQYSGAAFLAITLGYHRALLSMSLLLLIMRPFEQWGLYLWTDALLPTGLMAWLVLMARRYLPANPFIFLLGCGFLGVFLVCVVQESANALALAIDRGLPLFSILLSEQTAWGLLLAGGEATLEGMIITLLVVYCPKAVRMFDDQFYLSRPM